MRLSPFKVAIIDMYDDTPNLGMQCINDVLSKWSSQRGVEIENTYFNIRKDASIPGLDYDMYISTGGPGSPTDSIDTEWDSKYCTWLDLVLKEKKLVLLICHSFQIACRHFNLGSISLRKSRQIGVLPVHPLNEDSIFNGLPDPFFALESRYYQITEPNDKAIEALGATIIALEKERPGVSLERAIMGMKFNEHMYGVQFHPEAESNTLINYFQDPSTKKSIIDEFGIEKWDRIIAKLKDASKIETTFSHFIPNFLDKSLIG